VALKDQTRAPLKRSKTGGEGVGLISGGLNGHKQAARGRLRVRGTAEGKGR
jgi:hypothetical protein